MNFSLEDAKIILGAVSMIGIPFAVTWLAKVTWPDWSKFALAAVLSLVAGFLTAYSNKQLFLDGSLIQNAAVIFTAAQVVYYGAFRTLGLEKVLFPQTALAHHAEEQASQQTADITRADAKAMLDPSDRKGLDVRVNVVR